MEPRPPVLDVFSTWVWTDGTPLLSTVEPYRREIFTRAFDELDPDGSRPRYTLVLCGRAKKNWKTSDLVLAALYSLTITGGQCFILANDLEQAADDLSLARLLIQANPLLSEVLRDTGKGDTIERRDRGGLLKILPAGDISGAHGKTFTFVGFDEIHAYRDWALLEALSPDPTRPDALTWITSYASLHHRPGVPLFDLFAKGVAGLDPRMLFSWYAADYSTDPALAGPEIDGETRANPSRASWGAADYLEQQKSRLPTVRYRRLHLNLPGVPEGAAYGLEPVEAAVVKGVVAVAPEEGVQYTAYVDMSGGSNDDATLAIGYRDGATNVVVRVLNQGPTAPFDPRGAVARFAAEMKRYGVAAVHGDRYAGETFRAAFTEEGITYHLEPRSASDLYEVLEVPLNAGRVRLPDIPKLKEQILGLVWKGTSITHPGGGHDDWANAAAGLVAHLEWQAGVAGVREKRAAEAASAMENYHRTEATTLRNKLVANGVLTEERAAEIEAEHGHALERLLDCYRGIEFYAPTPTSRLMRAGIR